jgi:hypothetical protein
MAVATTGSAKTWRQSLNPRLEVRTTEAFSAAGREEGGVSGRDLDVEQALGDLGRRQLVLERAVELGLAILGGDGHAQVGEVFAQALVSGGLGDGHGPPPLLGQVAHLDPLTEVVWRRRCC